MDTIELSQLKVTNPYLRMGTDVSELENSIKTVGLIAPLVISKDNVILAGGRRYQALLNLGHTHAPVMIVDKEELERELISIDENLVRKGLDKVELEGNLRRAQEIYQALTPPEEETRPEEEDDESAGTQHETLPSQKFLDMVSQKTGFSPRQIHQAISRDAKASDEVKEARKRGELSVSHTNELIKLEKEHQAKALNHLKHRPVREVKKFIKLAKKQGLDQAIQETPEEPHAREYQEISSLIKKLQKQLSKLEMEGIEVSDFPNELKASFLSLTQKMSQAPLHENITLEDNKSDGYFDAH